MLALLNPYSNIFSRNTIPEEGWFRTLWTFLCFINAELHVDMLRVPKALREQDHTLMESFLAIQHYTWNKLYRLNLFRRYSRLEFLSEICNPEGDNISPEVWQGEDTRMDRLTTVCGQKKLAFEISWA